MQGFANMGSSNDQLKPGRKGAQKTVLRVKIDASAGKLKIEGPPSDSWSWRKYGQKPIKGSPYPRGYYRCSTSKGCSAKKQVERCRTDASTLIITYTSSHNHPGPGDDHLVTQHPKEALNMIQPKTAEEISQPTEQDQHQKQEKEMLEPTNTASDHENPTREEENLFHYVQSPIGCSQDIIIKQDDNANPFTEGLESHDAHGSLNLLLDEEEEPLSCPNLMALSNTATSEENDFFDELGELPTSSSFITSFMRSNFSDHERVLVLPS